MFNTAIGRWVTVIVGTCVLVFAGVSAWHRGLADFILYLAVLGAAFLGAFVFEFVRLRKLSRSREGNQP